MLPSDPALIQQWLADAQTAYHQLMTGAMAVEIAVDGNTQMTRFAKPDADKLLAYIGRLGAQLNALTTGCGRPQTGAIGAFF